MVVRSLQLVLHSYAAFGPLTQAVPLPSSYSACANSGKCFAAQSGQTREATSYLAVVAQVLLQPLNLFSQLFDLFLQYTILLSTLDQFFFRCHAFTLPYVKIFGKEEALYTQRGLEAVDEQIPDMHKNQTLSEFLSMWMQNIICHSVKQKTYIRYCQLIEHYAFRWDLVTRNICDLVETPRVSRYEIQPFTTEQAKQFLEASHGDPFEALYVLALTTGRTEGTLTSGQVRHRRPHLGAF